jgi:hypothetical protein
MQNVDLEMAKFILENTGGVNSPYYSDLKAILQSDQKNEPFIRNNFGTVQTAKCAFNDVNCAAGIKGGKNSIDYLSIQGGVFGVGAGVSVNLINGDFFAGWGKAYLSPGLGGSILFGSMVSGSTNSSTRGKEVSNMLGGGAYQFTGCVSVLCSGLNQSIGRNNPPTAIEYGIGTPGLSAGVGVSFQLSGD